MTLAWKLNRREQKRNLKYFANANMDNSIEKICCDEMIFFIFIIIDSCDDVFDRESMIQLFFLY